MIIAIIFICVVLIVTMYAVHHKFFDPYIERVGAKLGCANKEKSESNHTARQETSAGVEGAAKNHNPINEEKNN